jgi:thiamine-phosphate diphosphorylase
VNAPPRRRPLLCLVTDRYRLSPGLTDRQACSRLVDQVRAGAAAGIELIQIRERGLADGPLCALVARCMDAVRGTPSRVIVNDRVDVALAAGAAGAHLRSDSYTAARARDLAPPPFVLGRSVHSAAEARLAAKAGGLDYVIFGTVFRSASKPVAGAVAGAGQLAEAVRAAYPLPVFAIGGIEPGNASDIAKAGAAGIAAIGAFLSADAAEMARRVQLLQQSFDTSAVFP